MHLQFLLSIHRIVEVVYSVQMCPARYIANLCIVPRIVPYSSYIIVCIAIATYVRT